MPSLLLIPTGIGCEVGGFAGDAIPAARLLAAASGCLITHPNVMNGASLYWNDDRIHYVEGFSIDQFARGEILLKPVRQQRVGILLDAGLDKESRQRHLQVVDACRASLGLEIGPLVTTESPLDISFRISPSGSSWGELSNPEYLLRAGEKLKEAGATAIAVVTRFPEESSEKDVLSYRHGKGVDVVAGVEAVISHLLVRNLCLPCAHAPSLLALPIDNHLDPRVAGEELGHTFLTCVLVGLSRAPDLISSEVIKSMYTSIDDNLIGANDLAAVVAPDGALGGEAVLRCFEKGIPLISVANKSVLSVDLNSLGLTSSSENISHNKVFTANNYVEAAGILLALRQGLSIPSLYRPIERITEL